MGKNLVILYELVVDAYKNAVLNGYDLDEWSAQEVAEDMVSYDADLEDYFISDVVYCVEKFRENK